MDFTEKDMQYIAKGRTNIERLKAVPWLILAVLLSIPVLVLIETNWISFCVFATIIVVIMFRPFKQYMKSFKDAETMGKELYHQWTLEQKIINRKLNSDYD